MNKKYSQINSAIRESDSAKLCKLIRNTNVIKKAIDGYSVAELVIWKNDWTLIRPFLKSIDKIQLGQLLHISAALNRAATLRSLLKLGVKVNLRDVGKRTALHWAVQENALRVVRVLLENGANPDLIDEDKFTPLAIAAGQGNLEICKLLILSGAKVNKVTVGGTAIHIASAWGHTSIVKLLLKHGANVNRKNDEGLTPLDLAKSGGFSEIIEVLKSKM